MAAQMLLDRIEGRLKGPCKLHQLECELIVRESTDPRAETYSPAG